MLTNISSQLDRSRAIEGITRIYAEWAEATASSGETLEETSEGLLITDIAEAIGLTRVEIEIVMGHIQVGMATA